MLFPSYVWVWSVLAGFSYGLFHSEVATEVAAVAVDPIPTLKTSSDGTCGQGTTCLGSSYGPCCSEHFYCGNGEAYCGAKCHPEFGHCSKSETAVTAQASNGCASIVTRTASDRTTLTVKTTETGTEVIISISTLTSTLVIPVTSTTIYAHVVTSTSIATVRVTETATQTITETSQAMTTKTATTTATYYVLYTTTLVDRSTSTLFTTTGTVAPSRTNTALSPSKTFTGTASDCNKWYQLRGDETCDYVAAVSGLKLQRLLALNPLLVMNPPPSMTICDNLGMLQRGGCRVDCVSMFAGYSLCVGT
ncbi:hypothetical protein GQ53DRAFT_817290 [Thozetella sp. PMI_491]|nr:hypothetical protein GQ53DRAFT_817290 [Thozetella sp. PMI_491]